MTNQDWGPKTSWVQVKEEAELEEPFNFELGGEAGAEVTTRAITTTAATMIFRRETEKRNGTLSTHPKARSITCMTIAKVKAMRNGWAVAVAVAHFPGVEAGSCSGSPAPAPSGPMTSSVGKKERLKTTRVGQRTEKTKTIHNPQQSR